jgi:hypothetical protein
VIRAGLEQADPPETPRPTDGKRLHSPLAVEVAVVLAAVDFLEQPENMASSPPSPQPRLLFCRQEKPPAGPLLPGVSATSILNCLLRSDSNGRLFGLTTEEFNLIMERPSFRTERTRPIT